MITGKFNLTKYSKDKTIWKIPMNIKVESKNKTESLLLDKKSTSVNLSVKRGQWISLNLGTSGMYRLNYPEIMLRNLEEAVKKKSIPARDRYYRTCRSYGGYRMDIRKRVRGVGAL